MSGTMPLIFIDGMESYDNRADFEKAWDKAKEPRHLPGQPGLYTIEARDDGTAVEERITADGVESQVLQPGETGWAWTWNG
jgi:hypothetical protein